MLPSALQLHTSPVTSIRLSLKTFQFVVWTFSTVWCLVNCYCCTARECLNWNVLYSYCGVASGYDGVYYYFSCLALPRRVLLGLRFSCFPGGKHNYTKLRMSLFKDADRTVVYDACTCSNARTCVVAAEKCPAWVHVCIVQDLLESFEAASNK
jgi:hypothetical protein